MEHVNGPFLAPFVIGITVAGVGQRLAHLGAQAHLHEAAS